MTTTPIYQSRRFWLLMIDSVTSIVLHYVAGPDVTFLIAALQPVFIALIIAYTVDDTTAAKIAAVK